MPTDLSADVVVIGAGIAGSFAADRIRRKGASVLLLDSGPRRTLGEVVENFRNSAYKGDFQEPYPPPPWAPQPKFTPRDNEYLIQKGPDPYRAMYLRTVGGTTWHWAGQIYRYLPNDMKLKSLYGVGRDWPIGYDELEPYYVQAEYGIGVSGDNTDTSSPRSKPFPMPPIPMSSGIARMRDRLQGSGHVVMTAAAARNSVPYDNRPACCGNNNCMPVCPIDAQFTGAIIARKAEDAGTQVVPNAVVYRIEPDAQGRIAAVHYLDANKQSHRVTGKTFVLAANGVESPKLLLISASDRYKDGIANSSGMVGRNLMDHPGSSVEFFADEPVYFGRGPQRSAAINNFRDGDYRKEFGSTRIDLAATSPVRYLTEKLVKQGYRGKELNDKIAWQSARYVLLKSLFEMLPNPDNRLVPSSTEKDAWGIPRLEVHYKFDDYVNTAYDHCRERFADIAQRMGGTQVTFSKRGVYDNNQHITGTMIMGDDPKDSVVDRFGRAHDHENLFVVGTGIMPSSSCVNSTLTATALSLRTADHILATSL